MNDDASALGAYPTTFAAISRWAVANNVSTQEARVRFAQFVVLASVARSRELSRSLVFKGGNALDFIWHPNRSTRDLDFSFDAASLTETIDARQLHALLQRQVDAADREFETLLAIHRVRQQPPGPNRTFITYEARIGVALPDEQRLRLRMRQGESSPNVVPLDVSMNEVICADEVVALSPSVSLRVSAVEDILAEKLRALLQQPIRGRDRRQDLLDIAVILDSNRVVEPSTVSEFLVRKARARNVAVSKRAFRDPAVVDHATREYDALQSTTRRQFIPVVEALALLHDFIATLDIPDE